MDKKIMWHSYIIYVFFAFIGTYANKGSPSLAWPTRVAQSVNALDFNRLVSERTIEVQLPLKAALRESQETGSLFNGRPLSTKTV